MDLAQHLQSRLADVRPSLRNQRLVVAVSGGVDSMVLLHVLNSLAEVFGWKLSVAHFNHQLRGRASAADERLVQATTRKLGLPCDVGRGDVRRAARQRGESIEMAARTLRHAFLAGCATKRKAEMILLAQHADDQAELFLLRLLRGASGAGLGGMQFTAPSPAKRELTLIRPLLECRKESLVAYARTAKIRFREDASNASADHDRNWVRHELLGRMRARQPAAVRMILRSMKLLRAEAEVVDQEARDWLSGKRSAAFSGLPDAVQRQVIHDQLISLGCEPDFEAIERLRLEAGRVVTLAGGSGVLRDASGRVQRVSRATTGFGRGAVLVKVPAKPPGRGKISFAGVELEWQLRLRTGRSTRSRAAHLEWFDADKLGAAVELTHWQPGDRFQPIGFGATTKLQDWFTNRKVPAARRRQLILARTERGEVFWVEGERIGEVAKITPTTRRVLEWRWKRL